MKDKFLKAAAITPDIRVGDTDFNTENIIKAMNEAHKLDVKLAVFLYENADHTFKVSFRVNGDFDAAALAMHFGGGGHVKAAGCTVEGPAEEATNRILAEVEKRL